MGSSRSRCQVHCNGFHWWAHSSLNKGYRSLWYTIEVLHCFGWVVFCQEEWAHREEVVLLLIAITCIDHPLFSPFSVALHPCLFGSCVQIAGQWHAYNQRFCYNVAHFTLFGWPLFHSVWQCFDWHGLATCQYCIQVHFLPTLSIDNVLTTMLALNVLLTWLCVWLLACSPLLLLLCTFCPGIESIRSTACAICLSTLSESVALISIVFYSIVIMSLLQTM